MRIDHNNHRENSNIQISDGDLHGSSVIQENDEGHVTPLQGIGIVEMCFLRSHGP